MRTWLQSLLRPHWVGHEPHVDWRRLAGSTFVLAVAALMLTLGYQFPERFPDAANSDRSDRYNAWLQVGVFFVSAVLLLVRTLRWTWLGRAIVWVFLGITSAYMIIVGRHEGWEFFLTRNWLWATRFLVSYAGVVYAVSLFAGEVLAIVRRGRMRHSILGIPSDRLSPDVILGALVQAKPLVVADETGTILFAARSLARLYGAPVAEIEGKNVTILMPERFRDQHRAGMARFLKTGVPQLSGRVVQTTMLRADGSEVPVHLAVAVAEVGARRYFVASLWQRGEEIRL